MRQRPEQSQWAKVLSKAFLSGGSREDRLLLSQEFVLCAVGLKSPVPAGCGLGPLSLQASHGSLTMDSCDCIRPSQVIQDNLKSLNLIKSVKSLLPCSPFAKKSILSYSVSGIRVWTSLGTMHTTERLFSSMGYQRRDLRQSQPRETCWGSLQPRLPAWGNKSSTPPPMPCHESVWEQQFSAVGLSWGWVCPPSREGVAEGT